jgi:hypothetical protein
MLKALRKSLGVVTPAIEAVGIERTTHYLWMNSDPEYKQAVEDMKEVSLDFSETHLFKQIAAGNSSSTQFHLKTQGKKRGYVEASEQVIYTPEKAPSWLDGSSID